MSLQFVKITLKSFIFSLLLFPQFMLSQVFAHDNAKYIMYVHADCSHCKKVEDFLDQYGLRNEIEFKQLKNNEANMKELQARWDEFNVSEGEKGWPFMVVESTVVGEDGKETVDKAYFVGDIPIIDHLVEDFNVELKAPEEEASNTGLLAVGALILFAIFGYGVYSAMTPKK